MLSGISITCFAASYAVALALEISRLIFRSRVRGAVMLAFAGAGLVAHTWYLGIQAAQAPAGVIPLSGWFHWYLVAAWVLAVVYLYLTFYHPQNPIGLFVLPLVLGLIGVGYLMRHQPEPTGSEASQAWLMIHVVGLLLGTVAVLVGFAAGVMYLVESARLKHKRTPRAGFRLPSLEWLQRVAGRSLVVSTILVAVGFLAGLVRNIHLLRAAAPGGGVPWTDPVIWSSALLVGWLVAAVVFNAIYRPSRQGRKMAYLTVASFAFLVLVLAVTLFVSGHAPQHATSAIHVGYAQRTANAAIGTLRVPYNLPIIFVRADA